MKRRLIDLLPFAVGGAALVFTFVGWSGDPAAQGVGFVAYLIRQKTDFAVALTTLICQYFVTILLLREMEAELSGKWDISISPTNWKGEIDKRRLAAIVGTGTLLLSKLQKGKDSYRGILLLTFTDVSSQGVKTEIHRGAYEIVLTREKTLDFNVSLSKLEMSLTSQRVSGWSLAAVESASSAHAEDTDYPSQNKCLYDLQYSPSTRRMYGTAKMKDTDTISEFEALKIE